MCSCDSAWGCVVAQGLEVNSSLAAKICNVWLED